MKIGVPKEIKTLEFRVGMTPAGVRELVHEGHEVIVETNAGHGIGMFDADYERAGATVVGSAQEVFDTAELIVKVKEPQLPECAMLSEGQVLFTYLHLAPDPEQTKAGAYYLQKAAGGRGVLLGGVPGVKGARVVIIGGGVSGSHAADMAVGMGADVTILDRSLPRLRELDDIWGGRVHTVYSTKDEIDQLVTEADLVVGAVLVAGAAAPKLVSAEDVKNMHDGAVLVDISIDQGGCFETSRATTHAEPTYIVDGVVHYCVTNMPGAVPRTSTIALTNATLPFVRALAKYGWRDALQRDPHLANGLNVHAGHVNHEAVANDLGYEYVPPSEALKSA